jgi:predicted nucleic acid-binding protein
LGFAISHKPRPDQGRDRALAIGRHPGFADVATAATASMHGLVLLTRNMRHFEPLGLTAIDPVVALPPA